ncbi:NADP-dependent oxidoreductase [Amycolatopsis sp. cg5]|uniref:NADP-dependent oxidoreductase n=1 Tax=Amycolatopsis sp. cg5 TaxID=3238802 RepID=UPI0035236B5A
MVATEVRLVSRPDGRPVPSDFSIVDTDVPVAGPGQVLVRNQLLSVDPYMRGRMSTAKSYAEPYELGVVMNNGGAVGEVVVSNHPEFGVGAFVQHWAGWRTHSVLDASELTSVDGDAAPLSTYLGVLGMPGLTAYSGLFEVGGFTAGDTVFVSGAAGAVGSVAGQLAKLRGAKRVIGSAGTPEKVRHLVEDLGFDAAFNYKDAPVLDQLAEAAPGGIDLYFDNVGGDHLEAAIETMNPHGRIVLCGAISQYNSAEPDGLRNYRQITGKRLTLRGVLVLDHFGLRPRFLGEVAPLVRSGELKYTETFVDGIRNAPRAFMDMLDGANTGKMLVRL